jgi:hypothetical protein
LVREALIKYCFERDRLQAVRNVEQMNPALAAEGLDFDLIRVSFRDWPVYVNNPRIGLRFAVDCCCDETKVDG